MKLRQAWKYRNVDLRVARRVTEATENGEIILTVPKWLASEAQQWIMARKMEHASAKWVGAAARVSLMAWQDRMRGLPRQERGGDD